MTMSSSQVYFPHPLYTQNIIFQQSGLYWYYIREALFPVYIHLAIFLIKRSRMANHIISSKTFFWLYLHSLFSSKSPKLFLANSSPLVYLQAGPQFLTFPFLVLGFDQKRSKDLLAVFASWQALTEPRERKAQAGRLGQELGIWAFSSTALSILFHCNLKHILFFLTIFFYWFKARNTSDSSIHWNWEAASLSRGREGRKWEMFTCYHIW